MSLGKLKRIINSQSYKVVLVTYNDGTTETISENNGFTIKELNGLGDIIKQEIERLNEEHEHNLKFPKSGHIW